MLIDLFGPFQGSLFNAAARLRAYWYCTLCQTTYLGNAAVIELATVADVLEILHIPARESPSLPPADELGLGDLGGEFSVPDTWLLTFAGSGAVPDRRRRIVLVRGTFALDEWIDNLSNLLTELNPPAAAVGSANWYHAVCARALYRQLKEPLEAQVGGVPVTEMWTATGHSLGGTIAAMFRTNYPIRDGSEEDEFVPLATPAAWCLDFGSPRSGTDAFADAQPRDRRQRITNQGDPVTQVPPRVTANEEASDFGVDVPAYKHWGTRLNLHEDGTVTRPVGDDPNLVVLTPIWERFEGIDLLSAQSIQAHSSYEYARRIRAGIPVVYPATEDDPDFPGLVELDQVQQNFLDNLPANNERRFTPRGYPDRWRSGGGTGVGGQPPVFELFTC